MITLHASERGWLVRSGPHAIGWVQATPDGSWRAIDNAGRVRVANDWNKRNAAHKLDTLVRTQSWDDPR